MANESTTNRSKITVRVWTPIFEALVARTDAAFLRRDQFISHTLAVELPRIRAELPHRNSAKARRYMEARLRTLFASGTGARQFSLALDPAVAKELESLCEDLNIPRESLLNRLFMLLGASGHFLADRFTDLTPEPKSDSGFRADESQDDMTPFETPPKHLITTNWLRGGTFDVVALALDLTRADPATADYDKALAPLGRVESVVDDPLRWYRWMLQMTFHQRAMLCREAGKPEQATAMEQDRWTYTPFGMTFLGEELMDGFNCHMPDSWPEQESPSQLAVKPAQSAATAATAPVKQPK